MSLVPKLITEKDLEALEALAVNSERFDVAVSLPVDIVLGLIAEIRRLWEKG